MTKVHLEGMGVLGSMTAWKLHQDGIPFTWSDVMVPTEPQGWMRHAWKASTGLIYPSGDPKERAGYSDWAALHSNPPWAAQEHLQHVTERGAHWFTAKHVPHGAQDAIVEDLGALRLGAQPTIHVNVQRLVEGTRKVFAANCQRQEQPSVRVVTHGYSARLHHVVWGWSAKVRLRIDPLILARSAPHRPSFYMRKDRYTLRYALPCPGTDTWYAGSITVPQAQPKLGNAQKHAGAWGAFVEEITRGMVRLEWMTEPVQGWRPAPAKEDVQAVEGQPLPVTRDGATILCPPLGLSGVRYSPMVAQMVAARIAAGERA